MRYPIKRIYLSPQSKRRSGKSIDKVRFLVAHDTGNEGSTAKANIMYYERTKDEQSASAHIFVDSVEIVECIPAFEKPEKAWHVMSNATELDNVKWGYDANNTAIGVELCFGGQINTHEAYRRYVWTLAYLCWLYKLDPKLDIVGHSELDPKRKTDPENALRTIKKDMADLIDDVAFEYEICTMGDDPAMEELLKRMDNLERQVKTLQARNEIACPEWAKEAVSAAVKKGLVQNADNGSTDFYRLITVLHRAKVI